MIIFPVVRWLNWPVDWRGLFLQTLKVDLTHPLALALFVDVQNTYRGARRSFFNNTAASVDGQFSPAKLGDLIASRGGPSGMVCSLSEVRAYTGRPDPDKDPKTYSAHMKQCAEWQRTGVIVIHRQLRYPTDWPNHSAQEKGIDTALAIDFVAMAVDGKFDLGVIVSTDTDLLPALEFVRKRFAGHRHIAVAAWRSPQSNRRLSIPGTNIWCHWLDRNDYDSVADSTRYSS